MRMLLRDVMFLVRGCGNAYGKQLSPVTPMTVLYAQRFSAFDWRKAVSASSYLASKTGESLYFVLKMLYLADKAHLDQYGRFIYIKY